MKYFSFSFYQNGLSFIWLCHFIPSQLLTHILAVLTFALINNVNIASAAQVANQLSSVVVNLAAKQLRNASNSGDAYPLADLLSVEPLAGPFKSFKKDNLPKIDAADSALATLEGIKALTEVCNEDSLCQDMIVDFGI